MHLSHIAAALLAIAVTLLLASTLDDGVAQRGRASAPARDHAPVATRVPRTVAAPTWASDPFASLLQWPLAQPRANAER